MLIVIIGVLFYLIALGCAFCAGSYASECRVTANLVGSLLLGAMTMMLAGLLLPLPGIMVFILPIIIATVGVVLGYLYSRLQRSTPKE